MTIATSTVEASRPNRPSYVKLASLVLDSEKVVGIGSDDTSLWQVLAANWKHTESQHFH